MTKYYKGVCKMDMILKRLNEKGWFLMFSWQMPDKTLCKVFRRMKEPQFVISVCGIDEDIMYGDAEVKSAWIEKFIKDNDLERKMLQLIEEQTKKFKYIEKRVKDYHAMRT